VLTIFFVSKKYFTSVKTALTIFNFHKEKAVSYKSVYEKVCLSKPLKGQHVLFQNMVD